jgi:hypothetical protein
VVTWTDWPVISMPGVQAGWALTAVIGTMLIAIAAAACETLKVFIPNLLVGAIFFRRRDARASQ